MGMGPGFRAVATPPPSTHPVYLDMLHASRSTGALPPLPGSPPPWPLPPELCPTSPRDVVGLGREEGVFGSSLHGAQLWFQLQALSSY